MGWVSHFQCVLQLMMIYYVATPEMGVSILSDGVGKPLSVLPAADDDLLTSFWVIRVFPNSYTLVSILCN